MANCSAVLATDKECSRRLGLKNLGKEANIVFFMINTFLHILKLLVGDIL
jgi:hypothetical protein